MKSGRLAFFCIFTLLVVSGVCFGGDSDCTRINATSMVNLKSGIPVQIVDDSTNSDDTWTKVTSSENRDQWFGIYRGSHKIGYLHRIVEKGLFGGASAYKWTCVCSEHYTCGGLRYSRKWSMSIYMDEACNPVQAEFSDHHPGIIDENDTDLVAKFGDKAIEVKGTRNSDLIERTIPIPDGTDLVSYCMSEIGKKSFRTGQKTDLCYFNPWTLAIDTFEVNILGSEKVLIDGKVVDTQVLTWGWPWPCRISLQGNGNLLKIQSLDPMYPDVCVTQSQEEALKGSGGDGPELWRVAADRYVANPDALTAFRVRLTGIPDWKFVKEQFRQSVDYDSAGKTAEYCVRKLQFDPSRSLNLPISGSCFGKWLSDSDTVKASKASVCLQASEIVNGETNAYFAARRLASRVSESLKRSTNGGMGAEIQANNCAMERKAQIMYSELARAAGIPTRFAAGLRYRDGGFDYTCWVESYVGEWVPVDPISNDGDIDATYIKLYDGAGSDVFDVHWVIPLLDAQILD